VLGALVGAYGDDDEEIDGGEPVVADKGNKGKKKACWYYLQGKCKHGDKCTFPHPEGQQGSTKRQKKEKKDKKGRGNKATVDEGSKNAGHLLSRLLAKEIHEERSVVLQCFRLMVQKSFFGIQPS